jgi:uncharacterized membrane protein
MWQWLRRSFVAGFFVTVPLVVSVVAIVWVFRWADQLTSGLGERALGVHVPGLGILSTAIIVLAVGIATTNVIGRRLLQRGERLLLHVPLFRTIYAPVKQLLAAFSPESEVGFKRMVLVEDVQRGYLLGFLMREFFVQEGETRSPMLAVYVPTNHLYLGDVIVCRPESIRFPDLSVEEGIRVFLTGGMGLPERIDVHKHHADVEPVGRTDDR